MAFKASKKAKGTETKVQVESEAERKMEENMAKNAQIVIDLKAKLFESEQHYKNQTKLNAEVKEEQRQMIQQLSSSQT